MNASQSATLSMIKEDYERLLNRKLSDKEIEFLQWIYNKANSFAD